LSSFATILAREIRPLNSPDLGDNRAVLWLIDNRARNLRTFWP